MLALALLLGAACSDSKGDGADAATDRPADTTLDMGMAEAAVERPADSGTEAGDTGAGEVGADAAETGAGDAAPDAAAARLCDGTVQARLVYLNAGGGPLWPTFSFSGAYGHAFFVIDGTCHYWVGESYLKGIRTGVLLPAQADQIAQDLHYTRFASLKNFTGLPAPDASTRTLSDGTNSVRCTGDCTHQTPPEYQQAFQRLQGVFDGLFAAAMPAALPIRVIATDPDFINGPAVAWPLSWSPSEVMVSLQPSPPPSAGRLITSGTELSALRQLRQSAVTNNAGAFGIKVRDAGGKVFAVLPRDEAPAVVVAGLAAAATR